jgi:hypothetical protein
VVHTCNHNYSGGKDQEDPGLRPTQGKSFPRPYLKNTQQQSNTSGRVSAWESVKS